MQHGIYHKRRERDIRLYRKQIAVARKFAYLQRRLFTPLDLLGFTINYSRQRIVIHFDYISQLQTGLTQRCILNKPIQRPLFKHKS